MLIPMGVEKRLGIRPWLTFGLITANVAVYLLPAFSPGISREGFLMGGAVIGSRIVSEPWRFVTSQFLHGGASHLIFNMLFLFLTGGAVEDRVGRLRMAGIYFGGGFAADALHLLMSSASQAEVPLIGASGAIAGLMGAFVILMPWTNFRVLYFIFAFYRFYAGTVKVPALLFLGAYLFVIDLLLAWFTRDFEGGGVAHWAHVGGFVFGAAVSAAFCGFRAFTMTAAEREEAAIDRTLRRQVGSKRYQQMQAQKEQAEAVAREEEKKAEEEAARSPRREGALMHYVRTEDARRAQEEYLNLASQGEVNLTAEEKAAFDALIDGEGRAGGADGLELLPPDSPLAQGKRKS